MFALTLLCAGLLATAFALTSLWLAILFSRRGRERT